MYLTTLNRIVVILLVGGAAVSVFSLFFREKVSPDFWGWESIPMLVALSALVGTVVESVGELSRFQMESSRLLNARWMFKRHLYESYIHWRGLVEKAIRTNSKLKLEWTTDRNLRLSMAGLFLRYGRKETVDWLSHHFSLYILASDFAVLIGIFGVLFIGATVKCSFSHFSLWCCLGWAYWAGLALLGTWLMWSMAVHRFLYAYIVAFRETYLLLKDGELTRRR